MFAQLNGRQVREIQLYAQVRAELDRDGKKEHPLAIAGKLKAFAKRHNAALAKKKKQQGK